MKVDYQLHPLQMQIFNDPARYVVLCAGRRWGKTILAVVKCIVKAVEKKGAKVWYVAPTYKQAKEIAWSRFKQYIPREMISKTNETELKFWLINGSEIALKGCDNEDSLRGVGLDFVVLDEYALIKENVWREIIRPMLVDHQAPALFISTPKGKNHFWKLWLKGQRKEKNISSYTAKTEDNPLLQRSEIKEIKEERESKGDIYFRQEYEASFEDYTGLVWPEFKNETHQVIEPFEIPSWYETISALDVAMSGTTAALKAALDDDGNLFIVEEFYEQNKRASEVSEVIRGWNSGSWLIDPASKAKNVIRDGEFYSLYDEYAENGIHARPAENDVNAGINRVAEYFKRGKIKIFNTCENLLREIERYHWAEERETVSGIATPKPFKHMDHACDCLRYLVMSRAEKAYKPMPRSYDRAKPMAGELLGMR